MQVSILYGSETGNCENLANEAEKYLSQNNISAEVLDMEKVNIEKLQTLENVLVITSTWGDGEPPSNASRLHSDLQSAETLDLSNLKYSVFAIGQSFYDQFCQAGKDFDEYLEKFGAKRLQNIFLSDDDFEDTFSPWLNSIKIALDE